MQPDAVPNEREDGVSQRTQLFGPQADMDSGEREKLEITGTEG
jgi:hypothetical protein